MKPVILELIQVQKRFQNREVLKSVQLKLHAGEFLCLLGPSGSGKSTLLRLMAGLETPTQGRVVWTSLEKNGDHKFAFVFQESHLLQWRNVLENARLPLELQNHLSRQEQNHLALEALQKVHLAEFKSHFPHELSGGMKMRVSIARALSSSPQVLFMDEPFAALDEGTRFTLQKQLRDLCDKEGLSVVFVTHSTFEAAFLADRVAVMRAAQGEFLLEEEVRYSQARDESLRLSSEYLHITAKLSKALKESLA